MERLWTLIPIVLLSAGCAGSTSKYLKPFTKVVHEVEAAIMPAEPLPATVVACAWASKLQQLPDPTRGGQMTTGIVGQIFIYSADNLPTDIRGELTVMVHDDPTTPRAPHTAEVWHFDNATLKNMVVSDDRYGQSLAVFIPWPSEWNDVSRLVIQSRYDQKDLPPIWSRNSSVSIDHSMSPSGASAGGVVTSTTKKVYQGVPDPNATLRGMKPIPINRAEALPIGTTEPSPLPPAVPVSTSQAPAVNSQTPAAPGTEFRSVIRRSAR